MKSIMTIFWGKPKPRRYPMPEPSKIIQMNKKEQGTSIELILAIVIAVCLGLAMSACSSTAKLPNGCKYKTVAPKFKA